MCLSAGKHICDVSSSDKLQEKWSKSNSIPYYSQHLTENWSILLPCHVPVVHLSSGLHYMIPVEYRLHIQDSSSAKWDAFNLRRINVTVKIMAWLIAFVDIK